MEGRTFPDPRQAMNYLRMMTEGRRTHDLRQKFVKDFQRIHDRRKYEPCNPYFPGHDQEGWFAKLGANGIWERVFQYLTNPSDVMSAYFACEIFRNHLEEKIKFLLLPMVFKVLQDTHHLKYSGFGWIKDETKGLNRDVLNQRLVSKKWKKSAEEVLLVQIALDPSDLNWRPLKWDWLRSTVCRFEFIQDVDKAMEGLRSTSTSASLVRLVEVFDDDRRNMNRGVFFSKLLEFLDMHGQAVWGFRFSPWRTERDFCYEDLWNLVSRMPNLKALWISDRWDRDDYHEETFRVQFQDASARQRSIIAQKPFPSRPTLELCHLDFCPAINETLVAEILSKNTNIISLDLRNWSLNRDEVIPGFVWDAMQNLRLEKFHLEYHGSNRLFADYLLRVAQCEWPLRQMWLKHLNFNNGVDIPASTICSGF